MSGKEKVGYSFMYPTSALTFKHSVKRIRKSGVDKWLESLLIIYTIHYLHQYLVVSPE